MPASQGVGVNCYAFLRRDNWCWYATTRERITSRFIFEQMEQLSLGAEELTVVVWDNAPVHVAGLVQARRAVWVKRGLYLFYLPRYSPHLNTVETLWRKLKYEWPGPSDYETGEGLFYTVRQALAAVGKGLEINFSNFALA